MSDAFKEVSYIRARDPSIIHFNRRNLANVRKNIGQILDNIPSITPVDSDEEGLEVYLRIKPSASHSENYIIEGTKLVCIRPEVPSTSRSAKNRDVKQTEYSFTNIFGPESTQMEVFNHVAKEKVLEFINGRNAHLFTYGASGAGKSYTLIGNGKEPGLVPQVLHYLFRTLPKLPSIAIVKPSPDGEVTRLNIREQNKEKEVLRKILNEQKDSFRNATIKTYRNMQKRLRNEPAAISESSEVSVGIWISFCEIYNEEIYDLLDVTTAKEVSKRRLRLGTMENKIFVKDLIQVHVSNGIEAFQVFQFGIQQLKYAKTDINIHSNRSHSIFTITLAQSLDNEEGVQISTLNFCDLAGTSRIKEPMDTEHLLESKSINTSLMILGKCFEAFRSHQKCISSNPQIPYRESKLTQLLQNMFTNREDLTIIVNINTSPEMFNETQNTLNFPAISTGSSLQSIETRRAGSSYSMRLDEEIIELEQLLADTKKHYQELCEQGPANIEMEKKHYISCWEDLLQAEQDDFKLQKDAMIKKMDRQLERKLTKLNRKVAEATKKAEKKETKKTPVEILKEEIRKNSETLHAQELHIAHLEKQLDGLQTEGRNISESLLKFDSEN